ncbi:hypothetical protein CA267_004510 [Alteromonas pelagimontana]|uniref:Bacterial OB-fold domain-containing protein n=1 Tax=Alteromonas pelagimontana TaxID=1858656 RepID=A0A6M4MBU7_9ALTE|nr:OB-fold nucleic acid binding domain-containing protein [Alteromonas pelagimontana]QJR80090.1 hypothetical protein CA267_004510 [Alteromonas pelagimontana]
MFHKKTLLALASSVALVSANPVIAKGSDHTASLDSSTWVTVSGEVREVDSQFFTLDYGEGNIIVEIADTDFDAQAFKALDGDTVTVSGKIDGSLFSNSTLQASSVYIDSLRTTFISDSADSSSRDVYATTAFIPSSLDSMLLIGNVSAVSDEAVQISVGDTSVTVNVDDMRDSPVDDEGYLKLAKGDRVKVSASLDDDFFTSYSLDANYIIKVNGKHI